MPRMENAVYLKSGRYQSEPTANPSISATASIGAGFNACSDFVTRYSITIHVKYKRPTDKKL